MDWKIICTKDLVPRYGGASWYLGGKHRTTQEKINLKFTVKFRDIFYLYQYS